MPKRPPQGRGSGGRVTPSAKSAGAAASKRSTAKGGSGSETNPPGKRGSKGASKAEAKGATKDATGTRGKPRARVQTPSPRASSASARRRSAAAAAGRSRRTDATTDVAADADVDDEEADELESATVDADDGAPRAAGPTGWRALLRPTDPDYIPPNQRERPWWGMGDMGLWFLASQILVSTAYYTAITVGGYSPYWPIGPGARTGEVIGRMSVGQAPSVTKTVLDMPLALTQTLQIPLWIAFLGGALYASRRKGTSLKEDFGFTMKWKDIPIGLAIGAFAQVVVLTVLYKILFIWIGERDVSAQAREITSKATTPGLTILLVLGVAVAAPVFEELFFRGLSQRAIAKRLGPALGVVLSSLFFALAHFQTLQFPGLLAFGLILGFLAHRFGRLGPSIWAHIGFNLVAALLLVGNVNLP